VTVAAIGLNALALRAGGSGVQTYIRNLISALAANASAPALRVRVQGSGGQELPPGVTVEQHRSSAGLRRFLRASMPFNDVLAVHGLDVDLPFRSRVPLITTVHDLAVFDVPAAGSRSRGLAERQLIRSALRRADRVIAVSGFTADRISCRFGRGATVTWLAPDPIMRPPTGHAISDVRRRYRLPPTFVLQVATVEPRKNTSLLAEACAQLDVPLVLAGSVQSTPPAGARLLGYVPRPDLPALYGAATVVAYMSDYEGFGLPPLEALACGAALVASRVGGLSEILGDFRGLVPPGQLEPLTTTLRCLLPDQDARAELGRLGRSLVSRLSWQATGEQTLGVYRSLGI
jgi:glycosyltransferase involved in cell wall biosynthesis